MMITGVKLVLLGLFLGFHYVSSIPAASSVVKKPSQDPQVPVVPTLKPLTPGQVDQCQVLDYEKVPCGEPGITAAQCSALSCCFAGQQCYYGRTVTLQCTLDGQFVLVVARDTTRPRISLDSISMLGGNSGPCAPADSNTAFAIYQFPVTACGTNMMVQAGYVIYENVMFSSYEVGVGPHGTITRDTTYQLYLQCKYSAAGFVAAYIETATNVDPLPIVAPGPLQVQLRLGNGKCAVKGCVAEQVAYSSYYSVADYPVTKYLREPVYVEVGIMGRTDPNIVLVLGDCWATASPNPYNHPQWDLLVNRCPYMDDRYLTKLMPVNGTSGLAYPTHYRRFILKMFAFVDSTAMFPLHETLFIHCSTAVCLPTAQDSCEPACGRKRRNVAAEEHSNTLGVVSSGKIIFIHVQDES